MLQSPVHYDVCIIGAGPAGMMAAIAAGQAGACVCVLEKNFGAGRKLLITGGGRCNLTHTGDIDGFVRQCRPCGNTLKPAFYAFSPQDTVAFFHQRGLETYAARDGCIFPKSERAGDVCQTLVTQMRQCGVEVRYSQNIRTVHKEDDGFVVVTEKQRLVCRTLIIATGGKSWPQTGSTGDGYRIAERFGHSIIPPVGILCPMTAKEKWAGQLQGLSLPKAAIRVKVGSRTKAFSGEMVFTDDGIGGPAVFDISRIAVELLTHQEAVPVTIDFLPDVKSDILPSMLIERCTLHPQRDIAGILSEWFPKRLSALMQTYVCGSQPVLACRLLKLQRQKLVEAIKTMPLTLIRSGSLEKATVTRGGVSRQEIDSKTMQSRVCGGLFFAGEVIDVDGPCGGYNLQIAFSTGVLAGRSAVRYLHLP